MRMGLDELKARVMLYYSQEQLIEYLGLEYEVLVDLLEEPLWDRQRDLIEDMGVDEEAKDDQIDVDYDYD
jgi:hypothetical protein